MFLALGIYSRKLWLNPLSEYDNECHVVNEIWDESYNKWIMLDTTNNLYWVDENNTPLSALEVRDKFANQQFVTPVQPDDNTTDLTALNSKYQDYIIYTAKNMAYLQYFLEYGAGEADILYTLLPENITQRDSYLISEKNASCPSVK